MAHDERLRSHNATTIDGTSSRPYPIADASRRFVALRRFDDVDMMMFALHRLNGGLAGRDAQDDHADGDAD